MEKSRVIVHMVSSLDGFIAKKDNDISWMQSSDVYDKGVTLTDEYISDFIASIDCYVMGSVTYEHALKLGWPYGDIPVKVVTRRSLTTHKSNVSFYSGDLNKLINEELKPNYASIWVVGGAQIAKQLLRRHLVDEIVLSIMPVLLGDGILFFDFIGVECQLHLKEVTPFTDGMVELTYLVKKEKES